MMGIVDMRDIEVLHPATSSWPTWAISALRGLIP